MWKHLHLSAPLCIAYVIGVCALQYAPTLPSPTQLLTAPLLLAALFALTLLLQRQAERLKSPPALLPLLPPTRRLLLLLLLTAIGAATAGWRAQLRLENTLPPELVWKDITVEGIVTGFPKHGTTRTTFELNITRIITDATNTADNNTKTLTVNLNARLSDYHNANPSPPALANGNHLRLRARLRPPTSSANPHGFDYAGHLFSRNIRLVGYVRERHTLTQLADGGGIRRTLHQRIADSGAPQSALIAALVIGDRSRMDESHWRVLRRTGTAHLVSVSGVHIGLILFFAALLVGAFWRRKQRLTTILPAQAAAMLLALPVALAYALLAGFAVPVQRSFLMVAAAAAVVFLGGLASAIGALALAMLVVVLIDPWAVLAPGFWLSFALTASVLAAARNGSQLPRWREMATLQLLLSIVAIPLTLWFFNEASLSSPIANLLAVPVVGIAVLPLSLIGVIAGDWCWHLAGHILEALWLMLQWLADLPLAAISPSQPPWWLFLLALAGACWLLLPRGVPLRTAGALPIIATLLWTPTTPPFGTAQIAVLDVGQGTAVVVRTQSRTLVYDTGKTIGGHIVADYLQGEGINQIDTLILSHDDHDHRGGTDALLQRVTAKEIIASDGDSQCRRGRHWQHDGVSFRLLHPSQQAAKDIGNSDRNDNSCVLLLQTDGGKRALFTGDVSAVAEFRIFTPADVLLVAHHGSRYSSGTTFLRAVAPSVAVISVGRNNHGHPHPQTLARLKNAGAEIYRTDTDGAVLIALDSKIRLTRWRQKSKKYWRTPAND